MKTPHVLAVTLTLIMLLAAVVPASAAAEPVISNYWIDLSGGSLNPCTNEWVEIRGVVHIVDVVVLDENGAGTSVEHSNARISGVGETGTQYLFPTVSNYQNIRDFDYTPYIYTEMVRYEGVTAGPGNNEVYWELLHTTVNANGTVTSEVYDTGWECR